MCAAFYQHYRATSAALVGTLWRMDYSQNCCAVNRAKRHIVFVFCTVCAHFCGSTSAWASGESVADLGALLFTPAQRASIIQARRQTQPANSRSDIVQKFDGVVSRSNGKSTLWINGQAQPEGQPNTPPLQGVDAVIDGKRLRVGESLDPLTGTLGDVVAPGAVSSQGKR